MEELRDAQGRTEEEFLRVYDDSRYPHPSLTADNLIFSFGKETELLLIRRKGHPYLGFWALPGGFAEPGESVEETARRELREETGLSGLRAESAGFFSAPGRDPRGWVVSQSFLADVGERKSEVKAGDDAGDARWFTLSPAREGETLFYTLQNGGTLLSARVRIEEEDGQYMIVDCRSTNGTWVNGIRLRPEERYPLREGDVIRFADIKMRFK